MIKRHRSPLLVALLVLGTVLWGSAVAGHLHLETQHQLCDICLLPHAAGAGEQTTPTLVSYPPQPVAVFSDTAILPVVVPAYQGRAPPA